MERGPFPPADAELNNYFQQATTHLTDNAARLGITNDSIDALNGLLLRWNDVYPSSTNANTRTATITSMKNTARENLQEELRALYADIAESRLTPQDRTTLNIKARGASTPTLLPTTRPVGKANTSERLRHTISFTDEATPQSRAKPARVRGCQIWHKVGGDAPADPKELQYLATDTASPYIATYDGVDAGKPVYYWLRWENTVGECGPWSETVVATITA